MMTCIANDMPAAAGSAPTILDLGDLPKVAYDEPSNMIEIMSHRVDGSVDRLAIPFDQATALTETLLRLLEAILPAKIIEPLNPASPPSP